MVIGNDRPAPSAVHTALHRDGHTRRVALVVPSYLAAVEAVAATDLVAALPSRVLVGRPVAQRPLPVEVEPFTPRSTK